jgi:methionyl-tRNA synthetase
VRDAFYVTTPIYYVNGAPHIGHAYTTIAADTAIRWRRVLGRPAFLLTGTDEHGQKVLQAAEKRGLSAKAHCDELVVAWKAMMSQLGVEYDRFIRTTDPDHERVVQDSLSALYEAGLIYRAEYEGWYYVTDEIFVTDKDVEEGKYERDKLIRLTEENWWFKMGAFQQPLLDHIAKNPDFIRPPSRRNEVLGFLRKPLGDLCISRPKERMSWGIEIPFDRRFVTYVWFDALLNYLTGIGWHPFDPKPGWDQFWPPDFQLLGKDILTTHAVYWSTMLMGLQQALPASTRPPLPRSLFAHGWWTLDGQKISKSLGNTIDVDLLVRSFGVDATRYFFLREIPFGNDGVFSYEAFLLRYNADLADKFGNLAHRGLSMTQNWLGGAVPAWGDRGPAETDLIERASRTFAGFCDVMDGMQLEAALDLVIELVRAGNKYVDTEQPWTLNKLGNTERLKTVQRATLEVVWLAAALLAAVMPGKSAELAAKFGGTSESLAHTVRGLAAGTLSPLSCLVDGTAVVLGDPLFPRHRELPEAIAALLATPAVEEKKLPEPVVAPPVAAAPTAESIVYEDFAKVKLRTGKVLSAEKHPNADKLLVLKVEVGEPEPRTIVAGIASKFAPEQLVGRTVVVVVNLAPAKLRGIVSQGMLLAAGGDKGVIELVTVPDCGAGEVVR